jgi:hypothetical protein
MVGYPHLSVVHEAARHSSASFWRMGRNTGNIYVGRLSVRNDRRDIEQGLSGGSTSPGFFEKAANNAYEYRIGACSG